MHIFDHPIETVHLYVGREGPKQPFTLLPLVAAFMCLVAIASLTTYSGQHPAYEHQTLTVPAQFLPPQTFTAAQAIIPTGVKTYPATTAHGVLTITNGSIIAQVIPAGFTISNVATDYATYVPAGNANGYGYATVRAHALVHGKGGNFARLAINQVIGSSVYIRNLSSFSGGHDSYSVKYVTAQDKQTALTKARSALTVISAGLHYPCLESTSGAISVTWHCQMLTYHIP